MNSILNYSKLPYWLTVGNTCFWYLVFLNITFVEDNEVIDLSNDDVKTETKSATKSKNIELMDISK